MRRTKAAWARPLWSANMVTYLLTKLLQTVTTRGSTSNETAATVLGGKACSHPHLAGKAAPDPLLLGRPPVKHQEATTTGG